MSQSSSPDKAPSTDKTTEGHSNSWEACVVMVHIAAPTRRGTPAPATAPAPALAAQVLQRGPLPRIHPVSFDLERSVGPTGRHSYRTATKLHVMEYTHLRYPDDGVVGNRGGAAGWDRSCLVRVAWW